MNRDELKTSLARLAVLHSLVTSLGDSGKIKIQKLMYFMQEAMGLSLGYRFRMHHYGPYAEQIESDIATLRMLGFLSVSADAGGYGYHVRPAHPTGGGGLPKLGSSETQTIGKVVERFGRSDVATLELMATVHFAAKLASLTESDRGAVIGAASRYKPKFDRKEVEQAYDRLTALRFL